MNPSRSGGEPELWHEPRWFCGHALLLTLLSETGAFCEPLLQKLPRLATSTFTPYAS
jgi:hypothetical protein